MTVLSAVLPPLLAMVSGVETPPECLVIHYAPDGSRTVLPRQKAGGGDGRWNGHTASAHASGATSARSSVSVHAGPGSAASSVSQSSDGRTRTTTIRDSDGCRIIIDERPDAGD